MKTFIYLTVIILLLSSMQSCTFEKRLYSKGYHIEWKCKGRITEHTEPDTPIANNTDSENIPNVVINESALIVENKPFEQESSIALTEAMPGIKHQSLQKEDSPIQQEINPEGVKVVEVKKSQRLVDVKKEHAKAPAEKNRTTALLLCIFFGYLGIHRFYLGYTGMGVLYLLTVGLFGIGWLIDLIRLIFTDNLKEKQG